MSRSYKTAARGLAVLSLTLLVVSIARADAWATLDAPPTGIADPGEVLRAGHLGREIGDVQDIIHSRDVDLIMPRVQAAGLHTLSRSNAPVFISPATRSFFVPDPQGFWLEFMDQDVKRDPAAPAPSAPTAPSAPLTPPAPPAAK